MLSLQSKKKESCWKKQAIFLNVTKNHCDGVEHGATKQSMKILLKHMFHFFYCTNVEEKTKKNV